MTKLDSEQDISDAIKQFNMLENSLLKNRTLTIFGEITKDLDQKSRIR